MTRPAASAFSLLPPLAALRAAAPEWKDAKGATFRGDPVEVVGPMALFRTGSVSTRFVPTRAMSPEDCVCDSIRQSPDARRAGALERGEGRGDGGPRGKLKRSDNRELKPIDFAQTPEPEMIIAVFIGKREGSVNHLLDNLAPFVSRVRRVYPGRVEAVILPSRQANMDSRWLPARSWLVADPGEGGRDQAHAALRAGAGHVVRADDARGLAALRPRGRGRCST